MVSGLICDEAGWVVRGLVNDEADSCPSTMP